MKIGILDYTIACVKNKQIYLLMIEDNTYNREELENQRTELGIY